MIQRVSIAVSVTLAFDAGKSRVFPKVLMWNGRVYRVTKIGLHHTFRNGRTLYHVFSVETPELFFRLVLDTDNLHWRLEEISDGEAA